MLLTPMLTSSVEADTPREGGALDLNGSQLYYRLPFLHQQVHAKLLFCEVKYLLGGWSSGEGGGTVLGIS